MRKKSSEEKMQKNGSKRGQIGAAMFLPLSLVYLELIAKIFVFSFSSAADVFVALLTAAATGAVLSGLMLLCGKKIRASLTAILLGIGGVLYSLHMVYYAFFQSIFVWSTLGMAGGLTEFWRETLTAVWGNFYKIVLSFLPFILFLIFGRRWIRGCAPSRRFRGIALILVAAFAVSSATVTFAVPVNRELFFRTKTEIGAVYRRYGVIGGGLAEAAGSLFEDQSELSDNPFMDLPPETETDSVTDAQTTDEPTEDTSDVPVYDKNVLNIDFDALIAGEPKEAIRTMHSYFATVPASSQNAYTGYFKGKNLIFLTLEGFSYKAIDPERTPTLYKMYTEGFVFRNFYDTMWGGSTATGEYSNMTGNFYTTANCLKMSAKTLTYSALGSRFRDAGYDTYAYHNHTYTYYGRNLSHPNFGYNVYKGVGNGLQLTHHYWPNSDLELAQATADEYLSAPSGRPFHVYYMTVSGHANYTWDGNRMCSLHRNDIPKTLPYSENVKAYFACQLEVELMLSELVQRLKTAGQLENTVFAMCCDHYPYGLSDGELGELYGLPATGIRNNFELYRNAFILWSADMTEPVTVDTVCSSYDIAPTLYNLFGIPYDSRLITGTDILSEKENIAIINTASVNWSWITDRGSYNASSKVFLPADGSEMSEEERQAYVALTNRKVAAMRTYSMAILEKDYYGRVFSSGVPGMEE